MLALGVAACSDHDENPAGPGDGGATGGTGGTGGSDAEPPRPTGLAVQGVSVEDWPGYVTDFVFLPSSDDGSGGTGGAGGADATKPELLALDKEGVVLHYRLDGDALELLGQVELEGVHTNLDCGLISIALDPDFETNGFIYLGYCTSKTTSGIRRFKFDPTDYEAVAETGVLIIEQAEPKASRPWHNVGWIGFDEGGALFALFGDKTVKANGQKTTSGLGAVLRIIPERDEDGGYVSAPGNPGESDPDIDPSIYAWGVRSPWRGGMDTLGRVWLGDVGENSFEEVNVVSEPGQNFGWSDHEGPCEEECDGLTDPAFFWNRKSSHPYVKADKQAAPVAVRVVWVGSEYVPRANDPYRGLLKRRVLFGDACLGFTRSAWVNAAGEVVADDALGHLGAVSAIRQAPDGYLYASRMTFCGSDRDGEGSFVRVIPK